jgi:cytoskeletal protein CcmA (bactofilin family)
MFLRPNKAATREQATGLGRAGMPTIIGADFRVKGDISCEGDIQLEGRVDGNIKSVRLTVGETGVVQGDVNAEGVRVQGKIVGTIKAKIVELAGTAHVTGDILHESLAVENGAFLNGHCRRMTEEEIERDKPPVAVETEEVKAEEPKKTEAQLTLVSGAR